MRLWSFNPALLDEVSLAQLWKDVLRAQKLLLQLQTKPELRGQLPACLLWFADSPSPVGSLGLYAYAVYEESARRGKPFNSAMIVSPRAVHVRKAVVTFEQLAYELALYRAGIESRSPATVSWLSVALASWQSPLHNSGLGLMPGPIRSDEDLKPVDSRAMLAALRKVESLN